MSTQTTAILALLLLPGCGSSGEEVSSHHEALAAEAGDQEEVVVHPLGEPAIPLGSEEYLPNPNLDLDRDGFVGRDDPDDSNPFRYPGAPEQPCSGVDEDGDGLDPCPADVDGDGAAETIDCDDLDPFVSPYARDIRCNGRDENCNGVDWCDRDGDRVTGAVDLDPRDREVGFRLP